ncbi:6-hydroxypseudooxynicotine dehydrogenase complex subunit alpha [Dyadobacter sp. CECT 9275]|uniref:6-hydroxypseudooxynicotine dehydrogenase complex subunit alpha n=1 Tax=Dyadobacter helix TaxID=2822344 RepID=A0A916JA21_9BACT|nr:FAD binding domain-containing protein [Dyadobacter sp. CECT 9275]CAG4998470.1 6-hydroxypseudooxynicotine dehydrogenase complex subunit alpha [Dyadobacter sp. CECT 9275]
MIRNNFTYSAPSTLADAISLLSDSDSEVMTGDQAFVANVNKGICKPAAVISLSKIADLKLISVKGADIELGSGVSFATLLADKSVTSSAVLSEALRAVSDPHLRNHSTIGGALYQQAAVHAPVLAALLALDATVTLVGNEGEASLSLADFLSRDDTAKGKVVKSITFKSDESASGTFRYTDYLKSGKIVSGAAVVYQTENNRISDIRIAVSGCMSVPVRLLELEKYLTGKEISAATVSDALLSLTPEVLPVSNPNISNAGYLLHLTKVLIKRAILKS